MDPSLSSSRPYSGSLCCVLMDVRISVSLQILWKLSPESGRDLRIRHTAMIAPTPKAPVRNWFPGDRRARCLGPHKIGGRF